MTLPREVDAVVIGAGPNGLVAANRLADAGWETLLLEAQPEVGGAVRSDRELHPDFISDTFSAFYPLGAASPVLRELDLESHGLSWHEAVTAAGLPDPGAESARRLLLMLPAATGDVDLSDDAVQTVAAALTTVGAVRDQAETAAELLGGDERFWGTSRWRERDGMSVNQGGHSVRNPSELSTGDLRIVAEALRGKW